MKKIAGVTILIMFFVPRLCAQPFPYLSPGIRLGFSGRDGLTLTFKLSLGMHTDRDFEESQYYNLTVGVKAPLSKKRYQGQTLPFPFIQLQAGREIFEESMVLAGGGLGVAFLKTSIHPFLTLDAGFFIFPSLDVLIQSLDKPLMDVGLLFVVPMPLGRIEEPML